MTKSSDIRRAPVAESRAGDKGAWPSNSWVFSRAEFLQLKRKKKKFGFWSEELMKQGEVRKKEKKKKSTLALTG